MQKPTRRERLLKNRAAAVAVLIFGAGIGVFADEYLHWLRNDGMSTQQLLAAAEAKGAAEAMSTAASRASQAPQRLPSAPRAAPAQVPASKVTADGASAGSAPAKSNPNVTQLMPGNPGSDDAHPTTNANDAAANASETANTANSSSTAANAGDAPNGDGIWIASGFGSGAALLGAPVEQRERYIIMAADETSGSALRSAASRSEFATPLANASAADPSVPEPASFAILLLALCVLALVRRRTI